MAKKPIYKRVEHLRKAIITLTSEGARTVDDAQQLLEELLERQGKPKGPR